MRTISPILAVCAVLLAAVVSVAETEAPKDVAEAKVLKAQESCPVMGGKINKKLFADVDGKRIYVCCAGCIAPIQKEPAKYIKKLEQDGYAIDDIPTRQRDETDDK